MKKRMIVTLVCIASLMFSYVIYKKVIVNWGVETQRICYRFQLADGRVVLSAWVLQARSAMVRVNMNEDGTYHFECYDKTNLFGNWRTIGKRVVKFETIE